MQTVHRRWIAAALVAIACDRAAAPPRWEGEPGRLQLTAHVGGGTLSLIVVEVTAADVPTPLVFNLELVSGIASGSLTVPAGQARLLTAHAFDANGVETRRGSRLVDVRPGADNPPATLQLTPLTGDVQVVAQVGSERLVVTPAAVHLRAGETAVVTATVLDAAGNPVAAEGNPIEWATNRPNVAGVSNAGVVSAVSPGAGLIVATYRGVGAAASVWVEDPSIFAKVVAGVRPRGFGKGVYSLRTPTTGGRIWYVSPAGDDAAGGTADAPLKTINQAAQVAQAGDVVTIGPGVYDEAVLVKNSGTAERPIVFQAAERGSVVLTGGRHSFQPASWKPGPQLKGQWYVHVRGLVFRRYSDPLSTENAMAAVRAWRGWTIEDCLFDEAGRTGVEVRDSDVLVTRSTFQQNYVNALMAWGPAGSTDSPSDPEYAPITGLRLTDLIIWHNHVTPTPLLGDDAEYVLKIWGTKGALIDNIESYENYGPGLWFDTRNTAFTVRNSYFHHNRPVPGRPDDNGKGLFIEINWAPGLIENNVFIGNAGAGLNITNSQGIEVRNNLFATNAHCIALLNGNRGTTASGEPRYPLKDLFVHHNSCRDWGSTGAIATISGTFPPTPAELNLRVDANRYDPVRNSVLVKWAALGPLSTLADVRARLGWEEAGAVEPVSLP
jgi:hypothetical protein